MQLPVAYRAHSRQYFFVIGVSESETAGSDPVFAKPAPGQGFNPVRLSNPLVQMPIRQHQNLLVTFRAGFEQLIAPEQPAGDQVGRSAVSDLLDRSNHFIAIHRFLERNNTKPVLRDSHGLTAREATIVADEILVLMEENFDAGIEQLKKASPLSRRIVCSYFELPEAYRVFNPRLAARVEKLSKKFKL
jgi:hypothetical protein